MPEAVWPKPVCSAPLSLGWPSRLGGIPFFFAPLIYLGLFGTPGDSLSSDGLLKTPLRGEDAAARRKIGVSRLTMSSDVLKPAEHNAEKAEPPTRHHQWLPFSQPLPSSLRGLHGPTAATPEREVLLLALLLGKGAVFCFSTQPCTNWPSFLLPLDRGCACLLQSAKLPSCSQPYFHTESPS